MLHNHISYPLSENDLKMIKSVPEGGNWKSIPLSIPSKRLEQIRNSGGRTTLYGRLAYDKPSYTITTYFNRPGNGTYIHPKSDRVISAREAARLQSFPDSYVFQGSKTSFCKQIGNAVPPLLAYAIAKQIKKQTSSSKLLDLFCGAGGLSLGFEWAGYKVVAANDNFKQACDTFRFNNSDTTFLEGDITSNLIKKELISISKQRGVDIVVGGPPCQGFSNAGKRMIDDPRNSLYKEFVTIVKTIKPKVFVLENVEGIMTINDGKTFEEIKSNFSDLGYNVAGHKMHAVNFGVPQKRKRVIIIGVVKGDPEKCFPEPIIKDEKKYITVNNAIGDLPDIKMNGGVNILDVNTVSKHFYQDFIKELITPVEYIKKLKSSLQG